MKFHRIMATIAALIAVSNGVLGILLADAAPQTPVHHLVHAAIGGIVLIAIYDPGMYGNEKGIA